MTKDEIILAQQARIEQLRRVVGKVSGTVDAALSHQHAVWKREIDASLVPMDNLSALRAHDVALENCRLFAARNRNEEWAKTILRFCGEAGIIGSPLRAEAIEKGGEYTVIGEVHHDTLLADPLYQKGFQAGAASRDAEVAQLKTVPMKYRRMEFNAQLQKENDQLREQVALLREALLTCSVGDFSTGHVIYPSFDEKLVEEALAATEPKL